VQDRYFGDIGDFAKFGLLRNLFSSDSAIRLGVLWYRVPDEDNHDGRHIDYLKPTPDFCRLYRTCDHSLYDVMGQLVWKGSRSVALVQQHRLLPAGTLYHSEPLNYCNVPRQARIELRARWLASAYDTVADAGVVFIDPDNGLETALDRYSPKGPKFVYYDDLISLAGANKSLIIYQHACRKGCFDDQIRRRLAELRKHFGTDDGKYGALRFRRISPRAFLFVLAKAHRGEIQSQLRKFVNGPWGQHFELVHAT
jgi:hypothetical protein